MSFALYPAYKDSGVPWVHKVPEHWEVQPLLAVMKERNEPNMGMRENNLLSLSYGRIVQKDIDSNDGLLPESFETYQIVRPDDIVFRLTDLQNDKRSLRSAIVGQLGIITSAYVAGHPHGALPAYIHYLFRSYDQSKVFYSMGGGLRQSMKFADLKRMPVLLPPRSEQTTIATFLDRETAKIDALVAEQERLIALLKEKRQAVISHAVTKGLDPSVPMMDSGVEWLGKVPAHWLIRPIKHVGRLKGVAGFPHSEQGVEGEELCFYKVGSLGQSSSTGYLNESENTISRETASALGAFIFPKETLVFAKVGAALFLARVRALPADACLDNNMMGLVVDETKHAPAFVRYAMTLVRFDLIANPGAVPSLNEGQIGNFALAFPPSKAEQEAIAAFLDRATGQLEDLFAQAETVISTLRERRSALISAAVTGQIDVRGAPEQAP